MNLGTVCEDQIPGALHKRANWVNALPRWITEEWGTHRLPPTGRTILQAIANDCDPPAPCGSLVGAFGSGEYFAQKAGCSPATFWRVLLRLSARGYVCVLARGGVFRVINKSGSRNLANTYGIPGARGALDGRKVTREIARIVRDAQGKARRVILESGDLPNLYFVPKRESTPLSKCEYPTLKMRVPHSQNASPPSPIPSPVPSPVLNNHEQSHGAARTENNWKRTTLMHVPSVDWLKEPTKCWRLYEKFAGAGLIGRAEHDEVYFFAAAAHAVRVGRRPCALFAAMIRDRDQKHLFVSIDDEQEGQRKRKIAKHELR